MAGLLSSDPMSAAQPQPQSQGMTTSAPTSAPAPAPSGDAGVDDGETPNVTPEEQAQYDKFVHNGLEVLYPQNGGGDQPVPNQILNRLKEASDPIENLANTAVWLTTTLETSAEKGGVQLDDAVVLHGGIALLEELAQIAETAGIHDYSQKEMDNATYRAMDLYREANSQGNGGRVNDQQLAGEFQQINDADKAGDLTSLLPGIQDAPGFKRGEDQQAAAGGADNAQTGGGMLNNG